MQLKQKGKYINFQLATQCRYQFQFFFELNFEVINIKIGLNLLELVKNFIPTNAFSVRIDDI